jgi:hypothetical protein
MTVVIALQHGEVTRALRKNIGPQRSWGSFLSDCIRGRANFHGLTLMPVACVRFHGADRPLYDLREVHAFVHEACARSPSPTPPADYATLTIDLDPADRRPWHFKLVAPH